MTDEEARRPVPGWEGRRMILGDGRAVPITRENLMREGILPFGVPPWEANDYCRAHGIGMSWDERAWWA